MARCWQLRRMKMKKLYEKNELGFALMWIGIYVLLLSLADSLSTEQFGTYKLITAPLCIVMSVFIIVWIFKNGLAEKFGLGKASFKPARFLFFIPLIGIPAVNVWNGVTTQNVIEISEENVRLLTTLELVLHVVSMIGVGFLEEIIFRGFLFKAIEKSSVKRAIIISSVTFGLGHIVNLFRGYQDLLPTILQICYAIAIGFLFTFIFHRSGTLVPCIITHQLVNSLSIFGVKPEDEKLRDQQQIYLSIFLIVLCTLYSLWIVFRTKPTKSADD